MIFVLSYTMVHSNNQSKQAHYNQYHLKNCIFYIPSTTHLIITHTYNYVINILQVFIQKHIIERPSNITRATIPKTNIPKTNISIYYDIILYMFITNSFLKIVILVDILQTIKSQSFFLSFFFIPHQI